MSKLFSEKAINAANIFARIHKLDYIKYCGKWNNYDVYFASESQLLDKYTGYPTYIFVDKKNNVRFAKFPHEIDSILKTR